MADAAKAFLFGRYRLIPDRRALFADGDEVSMGGRAFDLLLALVERRDRVVLKNELIELVWPGRVVEEGNLTVHVASLRKRVWQGHHQDVAWSRIPLCGSSPGGGIDRERAIG